MSSVITIGFASRTRACIHTEFTPPIADDERRETLIHVALLTARTFAALPPHAQSTLAGTLREWIEDQFVACPSRLIAGDPMACLPRFASTFLAPVREYALASKGCDQNGGLEFFLPMALVSYLRHVVATYPQAQDLLKPALALCGAVVIQPLTMESHFQAAAASLPKVAPLVEKTVPEELVVAEAVSASPSVTGEPKAPPRPLFSIARRGGEKRRTLILSACLAALLIMQGVQYLSIREPERAPLPIRESLPSRPSVTVPPPAAGPLPPSEAEPLQESIPKEETPKVVIPPVVIPPVAPVPDGKSPAMAEADPGTFPGVESAVDQTSIAEPSPPQFLSRKIRAYQQEARELAEDATAQTQVMIGAIDGQILADFELNEVLAYGLRQVRARIKKLERLDVPEGYQERQIELRQILSELERLAKDLTLIRLQPEAGALDARLTGIHSRLEKAVHAIDNL